MQPFLERCLVSFFDFELLFICHEGAFLILNIPDQLFTVKTGEALLQLPNR